jgi:hypothetical protein
MLAVRVEQSEELLALLLKRRDGAVPSDSSRIASPISHLVSLSTKSNGHKFNADHPIKPVNLQFETLGPALVN